MKIVTNIVIFASLGLSFASCSQFAVGDEATRNESMVLTASVNPYDLYCPGEKVPTNNSEFTMSFEKSTSTIDYYDLVNGLVREVIEQTTTTKFDRRTVVTWTEVMPYTYRALIETREESQVEIYVTTTTYRVSDNMTLYTSIGDSSTPKIYSVSSEGLLCWHKDNPGRGL